MSKKDFNPEDLDLIVGKEISHFEIINEVQGVKLPEEISDLSNTNEWYDGDVKIGKPLLDEVRASPYTDEDGNPRYYVDLYIVDEEADDALKVKIKCNNEGDMQKDIDPRGKLFQLIKGIIITKYPETSKAPDEFHELEQLNLKGLRKMVSEIDKVALKVVLEEGSNNIPDYNSFVMVNPENYE